MSMADSISVFAEGTFEEQIQELVNYLVGNRSEEERLSFIRPFQDALKTEQGQPPLSEDEGHRRKVLNLVLAEVTTLGSGSDREIEGFFNLLFSHLFSLYSPDSPELKEYVTKLLQSIAFAQTADHSVKYTILSNLFNAAPRSSPLRLSIYSTLLELASSNDELEVLQLSHTNVQRWLSEWQITAEERSHFLKSISEAFEKNDDLATCYEYTLDYLRSLPSGSPATQDGALNAVTTALKLPSVFDFDPLFKLDAVVALKDHELFSLLQVYLTGGLAEYQAWASSHSGAFEKYGLDKVQLERKIRLLSLASLGFKHIGQDLPYSKISSELQIPNTDVEKWAIDVIRAGLVAGKLSQTAQTLRIIRATARTFEREQWEVLEKRLVAWKAGLANVLEVVAGARRSAASSASSGPLAGPTANTSVPAAA